MVGFIAAIIMLQKPFDSNTTFFFIHCWLTDFHKCKLPLDNLAGNLKQWNEGLGLCYCQFVVWKNALLTWRSKNSLCLFYGMVIDLKSIHLSFFTSTVSQSLRETPWMDGASIKPRFKDFFLKTHKEWKSTTCHNDKETVKRPITHHRYNFNTSLMSVYCHINGEKIRQESL